MSADDLYADLDARAAEPTPTPSTDIYADLDNHTGMEHTGVSEEAHATIPGVAKDVGMGALSAAADIGSTLLWPVDKALRAISPNFMSPEERRASLHQFFGENANPNSLPYKTGRLGGAIAGTVGIAPALGAVAGGLGAAPEIASALGSGGMSLGGGTTGSILGNAALRTGAGATVGGLSAGAVQPDTAGTGATIGAATPGAAWLLGMAGHGIGKVVGGTAKGLLGAATGTGSSAVEAAYNAGINGDRSFLDNMRGNVSFSDVVDEAKDALNTMRSARGAEYRAGMAGISNDKTVLDMKPITDAVSDAQGRFGTFHGEVVNENANTAISRVADKVNDWLTKDPATFHTPEGLDKLKQWVGGELENARPGTQTDAALKGIYNSIKGTISDQAPDYARVMSNYQDASEQLSEISRTLSLNPKASVDTSVRKLQSILRNNVTTNFGNRAEAVSALENQGGANLRSALAGQSMSSVWPRGIAGAIDAAAAVPAAIANPLLLASGVAASPRLVGEAAYGAGSVLGPATRALHELPLNTVVPLIGTQKPATVGDLMDFYRRKDERTPVRNP